MSEKNSIFRKKSLDRIESPEQLNDYIRVTSPGIWIFLAAAIVLLVGIRKRRTRLAAVFIN
mgnify:CR=1 FL=1